MPFRVGLPAIALSLLCNTASAVTWNTTTGQGLTFNAGSVAPGHDIVTELYQGCQSFTENNELDLTNGQCVEQLLGFMLDAVAGSFVGAAIGTANAGQYSISETIPEPTPGSNGAPLSMRRRSIGARKNDVKLQAINGALANGTRRVRATAITKSHLYPANGSATQFNVQTGHTVLNVHTNGTHALANFENKTGIERRSSGFLNTGGYYFDFGKAAGLKVQAYVSNISYYNTDSGDLSQIASSFAMGGEQAFEQSDSWVYTVCSGGSSSFLGMIIAEAQGFDAVYEEAPFQVDCLSAPSTSLSASAAQGASSTSNSAASATTSASTTVSSAASTTASSEASTTASSTVPTTVASSISSSASSFSPSASSASSTSKNLYGLP